MTDIYLFPEIAEPAESRYGFQLKSVPQPHPKSKLEDFVQPPTAVDYLMRVFQKYPDVRDHIKKLLEAEGAFDIMFSRESQ